MSGLSVVEDPLDDSGVLGWSGAEVPGRGVDGDVAEECLNLDGIGSALAEARAKSVAAAVEAQSRDADVRAGGQYDRRVAIAGLKTAIATGRSVVASAADHDISATPGLTRDQAIGRESRIPTRTGRSGERYR